MRCSRLGESKEAVENWLELGGHTLTMDEIPIGRSTRGSPYGLKFAQIPGLQTADCFFS